MSSEAQPVLLFRADAGSVTGTGHLVRTIALASFLSDFFCCKLITKCTIKELLEQARSVFHEIKVITDCSYAQELAALTKLADENRLVVIDGYDFDNAYQNDLRQEGFAIGAIDDVFSSKFEADIIVNHAGGISPLFYEARPDTVFYLGTRYLLLRKNFATSMHERRTGIRDHNCLICFGGADPGNETFTVLSDILRAGMFNEVHVVAGAANIHIKELQEQTKDRSNVFLHSSVSAEELKGIMQACSFAVCSPSTVVYEYLTIGGVVWLKAIADNQKHILRFLTENNMALNYDARALGWQDNFSGMLRQQQNFFDGRFGERLKKAFVKWFESTLLTLRKAADADAGVCWEWVNDPEVRCQSYTSDPIPWEKHILWFSKKIQDRSCRYYIVERQNEPVAQIRFDVNADGEASISYLTDKLYRNNGMGVWILSRGIKELMRDACGIKIIKGHVKKTNIASQRSFEKMAFHKTDSTDHPDSYTYTMHIYGN